MNRLIYQHIEFVLKFHFAFCIIYLMIFVIDKEEKYCDTGILFP